MAKKIYIGIDGVSRIVPSVYIGINNIARAVQKAYIGDKNGIARLFFEKASGSDPLIDFEYTDNGDGTYTLTAWKGTKNGVPSTELVIPNMASIIL